MEFRFFFLHCVLCIAFLQANVCNAMHVPAPGQPQLLPIANNGDNDMEWDLPIFALISFNLGIAAKLCTYGSGPDDNGDMCVCQSSKDYRWFPQSDTLYSHADSCGSTQTTERLCFFNAWSSSLCLIGSALCCCGFIGIRTYKCCCR